ncbi:hypothetical protein [Flavobacterium sp.]|uniref:hypothetical protein n=1 Tax=Flavobacterium sp. TaxID=239 RepID=UPI00286BCFC5|nr:hypothetical protein [Flavobacterium sp.]
MNYKCFSAFFIILLVFSCQKNDEKQLAEQQKDAKAKELIFSKISNGWRFSTPTLNPITQTMIQNWKELREFNVELNQTPKSSIGAFQKKAKDLSVKALALNNNIPASFNKPQIKSRIAALITKINSINLFINLDAIPEQKVIALVTEVDVELLSLYQQMDEIVRKNQIPKEEGESDMIRMLDTTRAIHN